MSHNTTVAHAGPVDAETIAALTDTVQRFIADEVNPHLNAWDEAGEFPRALYRRAGDLGLLGMGYPEAYGGTPASAAMHTAVSLTMARASGSGGLHASLFSHSIGLPPVLRYGTDALKQQVIPGVLRGERIAALAITEPGGGSDVANLRCTAVRDGDHYVINGEKIFITSGMRADWITCAVRTGEAGSRGSSGVSMVLVPGDAVGLSRSKLQKMGWWCSDTAHLRFDNVCVPVANLLGEEGGGFKIIMNNFNTERLGMAALAVGFAQACYDEALDWARQRKTFGRALVEHQVIRHKLADMHMRISASLAWVHAVTARLDAGDTSPDWVAQVCLLKNHSTQTMQFCADQAVQILGGMGFMRGTRSERIYREVKVMMIGGGSEEIMKDLAARQLGL